MEIEKIALFGVYLSSLWFVLVLYLSKKGFEDKISLIKMFSFFPIIGSYIFVVSAACKLFLDKEYIVYEFNNYNILFVLYLVIQIVAPYAIDASLKFYGKRKEGYLENINRVEYILSFMLTALFLLDALFRYELYRLTF